MAYNKTLLIITTSLISLKVIAQRPSSGLWVTVHTHVQLNKKIIWHNVISYRTLGNSIAPYQYMYRTGLRYQINKHFNTAAGVAFFFTRTTFVKENNEMANEFRVWEEMNYKTNLSDNLQLLTRFRTEQRYFSSSNLNPPYNAFRYRLSTQFLQKFSNKFDVQFSEEYFLQNINNNTVFDQNRIQLNVFYNSNKATQFQMGYMGIQYPQNTLQHILNIGFQKIINFHAK